MKICYIAGCYKKPKQYYSYLPFASLGEANNLSQMLFGCSLYDIVGGWPGITFFSTMFITYYTIVFVQKKKEMEDKKVERDHRQAKINAMKRELQDVVNIDKSKFR